MARSQLELVKLRDPFVFKRFSEPQAFGRQDIEPWLFQQAGSEPPLDADWLYWRDTMLAHCAEFLLLPPSEYADFLRAHATAFRSLPEVNCFGIEYPFCLRQHVAYLRLGIRVYPLCRTASVIFVISGVDTTKHVSSPSPDLLRYSEVSKIDVLDAVLKSWRAPEEQPGSKEMLCGLAAKAVAHVRASAEADFDNAVAVSADGTEIICAGLVIVRTGNSWVRYQPEVFREDKIRLDESCRREATTLYNAQFRTQLPRITQPNGTGFEFTRDVLMAMVHRVYWQILVRTTDNLKLFITTDEFCPDPLPEGGIPIR